MATTTPFDRMFLTGICIETALYGLNCGVFGAAMYVLIRKYRKDGNRSGMFLFGLSTAYAVVAIRQLFEAFIFSPPGTASAYFKMQTNPLAVTKLVLYTVNVVTQNLFLIWRLWAIWNHNWWTIVLPLLMEIVHTGMIHGLYPSPLITQYLSAYAVSAFIAIGVGAKPTSHEREKGFFILIVKRCSIVDWSMDLVINIGVTAAIALRLWYMARFLGEHMPDRHNQVMGIMRMILESGLLFASATIVTVSIYLSGSLDTVNAIDGIVQLATITPLLIIVRVGLGLTAGQPSKQNRTTEIDLPMEFASGPRHDESGISDDTEMTDSTHTRHTRTKHDTSSDLPKVEQSSIE
ncbi:hypothetical protein D9757_006950 [Collybiopsis confluens]|uniref:Uncharacterized protein n=1 Tax=Collybiopsis confluens TaxID=2823264 RepID=A0A8H5HJ79_9AGAR|nr:hypothetical protein D9757_006950 [Collybiopsis confluens]